MVKEEEIITEAGGRGYMDMLGLGEDYFKCLSPSSYFFSSVISTTATSATPVASSSPTCASYLDLAPPYHRMLSFTGQEQVHGADGLFGFQYYGGDHAIPVAVPQKSSPTTECSSSISYMSSSPTATAISAISSPKPQAFKKKGSRGGDQRKAAPAAATNKRPRVSRERLGERIIALQQLVSPFGKSDTASVLHEALGYIRFLHDQVQVQESAAGVVVEPPRPSDLRSRGLCLVPISCTEHVAGNGNGADIWSVAVGMAKATAAAENKRTAAMLPYGHHPGHLA
ncbi:transcription factor LATE FLOWERING-like isoform X2 [Phragmites australis]|uniref:transcription factor LATE FLOWERING-like isoform X2 n=1 Tax=Phragmites australis TaxID=29695 RepID=UPI002D799028|nr:transcription factor LATE FLOWERING-like isoform X2 [Phragmites australis]